MSPTGRWSNDLSHTKMMKKLLGYTPRVILSFGPLKFVARHLLFLLVSHRPPKMSLAELRIVKAFRAFNTVVDMVSDRGYRVVRPVVAQTKNEQSDWQIDFATFRTTFVSLHASKVDIEQPASAMMLNSDAMAVYGKHAARDGDKLLVFFVEEDSLSVNSVVDCRMRAQQKQCGDVVIVAAGSVNPSVRREVDELSTRGGEGAVRIQVFEEDELLVNVTKHDGTPKHVPLSPEEGREFLRARGLQLSQLPRILLQDPIVQYFGLERGRILKVLRNAEHCGEYEMYRQVI